MNRRRFLSRTAAALPAVVAARGGAADAPCILLRSSWQSVNIGDIGHTPGALRLLEKHFPEARVTLWPGRLGHGSRELLEAGFPRLTIAEGSVDDAGEPTTPELARAWDQADLYLNGSGSGFPGREHAIAFRRATGKPVGVFGVSTDPVSGFGEGRDPEGGTLDEIRAEVERLGPRHLNKDLRYIITRSDFFFCRETISRDYLRSQKLETPLIAFGPDAQLGMHLRDDAKAFAFLKANGLEEGKFICAIPRLRYTPYYRIRNTPRTPNDEVKDAINERTVEQDHRKMRDMITAYVRHSGNKVLACAEMTYQVPMAKERLVDPLPADVQPNVIWRDTYWLPDEAASVYAKALAVVSFECHSPLIALRNGTPAFYIRQPTDTCKGQMYRDFGAGDWFFEVDETDGPEIWARLAAIHRDPRGARGKVRDIMATVEGLQARMVDAVREACG